MFCITWLPNMPCDPTATVVTFTLPALRALSVPGVGGDGSPSLMMIMCLTEALT